MIPVKDTVVLSVAASTTETHGGKAVTVYGVPEPFRGSLGEITSEYERRAAGLEDKVKFRLIPFDHHQPTLKRGDRVWVDTEPSDNTNPMASDATHIVDSVVRGGGLRVYRLREM